MTFLKRLFPRAAVFKKCSGGITLWLALCFLVFLSLYQICFQSVWKQFQRQRAEMSAEMGMFSLLSEFEPHLLEQYDLFYLDTSFQTGAEKQDEICGHLWRFVNQNLTDASDKPLLGMELMGVNIKNLVRATDGDGAVFYHQAIRVMKERTGASFAEDWLLQEKLSDMEAESQKFQEDCEAYEGSVKDYSASDGEEEMDEEVLTWDGVWNQFSLSMAVPGEDRISHKAVNLSITPSQRELSAGTGRSDGTENQLISKQWFINYLCEYLKQAQEMLPRERTGGWLDYQLEYVLCGKPSDEENLDNTVRKLLLIREGANYAFLLSHPEYGKKAELLADVLTGITLNPAVMEGLKHLILLGWAYGESLVEVRQLLGGYELSLVKTEQDWQVPLSGLLPLFGNTGKYDVQVKRQEGIGYEGYLRFFLTFCSAEDLSMRTLDVIEGEVQKLAGGERIHLDHCVEQLTAQIWLDGIYLERTSGYE